MSDADMPGRIRWSSLKESIELILDMAPVTLLPLTHF